MEQEVIFRNNKVFVRSISEKEVPKAEQLLPQLFGVSAFLTPELEPYTKEEWVLERRMLINTKIPDTTTVWYRLAFLPIVDAQKVDTGEEIRVSYLPMNKDVVELSELRKTGSLLDVRVYPVGSWDWWFSVNYAKGQDSASSTSALWAYNSHSKRCCVAPIPNVDRKRATYCTIIEYERAWDTWTKEKKLLSNLFESRTNDHWNCWPPTVTVKKHETASYHILDDVGTKRMLGHLSKADVVVSEQARTFFKLRYDSK